MSHRLLFRSSRRIYHGKPTRGLSLWAHVTYNLRVGFFATETDHSISTDVVALGPLRTLVDLYPIGQWPAPRAC